MGRNAPGSQDFAQIVCHCLLARQHGADITGASPAAERLLNAVRGIDAKGDMHPARAPVWERVPEELGAQVYAARGGNFAKTMLRLAAERTSLKVVADQHGAPTSAALIADATAQVLGQYLCRPAGADLQDFPYGLYHLVAGGRTNWHEYAQAVVRAAQAAGRPLALGPQDVHAIAAAEYPLPAPRPANSCLATTRLRKTFGLCLPDWRQGLEHVLTQLLTP